MQITRTLRAALLVLAMLACLPAFAARSAAAQQAIPPDTGQTKTDPNPPTATATAVIATAVPASETARTLTLIPLRDEQGVLRMAAPPGWSDVAQGEWLLAGAPAGRKLSAAPNQADFAANWGTPGITVYYSTSLPAAMEPEDLLAVFDFARVCQDGGRGSLPPGERTVTYQIWQNCAEARTAVAVLVAYPTASRAYYGVIEIYLASGDDLSALAPILANVQFGPEAAGGPAANNAAPAAAPAAPPAADAVSAPEAAPTLAQPTPEPTPTPAPVLAAVVTDRLNLRSGPSTATERLTVLTRGQQLTVLGQTGNCAWLRVAAPDGAQGWVSGDPQFTSLGAACETIPLVENP